jgi:hypothetical protein
MKQYIRAQALTKSQIGDKIEARTCPVMEALAQLWLFPNSEETNHWKKEVWANLYSVPLQKRTHKPPRAEFILENTWELHKDEFATIVEIAEFHEDSKVADADRKNNLSTLYAVMEIYFRWLAKLLSEFKIAKPSEIYQKLDELGL